MGMFLLSVDLFGFLTWNVIMNSDFIPEKDVYDIICAFLNR